MMEAFYKANHIRIYNQDCRDMSELPDDSVDLIVTDPPYHLSDIEPLENRLNKVIRSFNDIVFPQFNKGDIKASKYSELVRILSNSSNLTLRKGGSAGIESWVGVPESSVDLNNNIEVRQIKINTGHKSPCLVTSNSELMDKTDIEKGEFIGDFILNFGDTLDFPTSDISRCNLGKLIDGIYTMPISAIESPSYPCLQSPKPSVFSTNNFMEDIRLDNYSFGKPNSTPFILARWRAENGFMLRFGLRGRTTELLPANTTDQINLQGLSLRPKLIRTFAGAGCLSTIFKSVTVSFILYTADGASSFYFNLFVPFREIIPQLQKADKGFMGKVWDVMPDKEIWRECLRVLKPGAFAFVMSIPRMDCLSRMGVSLEEAGFKTSFSLIYWCFASGFP